MSRAKQIFFQQLCIYSTFHQKHMLKRYKDKKCNEFALFLDYV